MLRVVLAVLFSVALFGVAVPVVEDARAERTGSVVEGELTRLGERAAGLESTEETGPAGSPRRVVSLSLPDGGVAAAPIDYVAIGGLPGCGSPRDTAYGDVVAYRTRGDEARVGHLPVDVRVVTGGRVRGDEDPLVLRGDATVTLTLVDRDGTRTVLVRRGTVAPALVAVREWGGRRA